MISKPVLLAAVAAAVLSAAGAGYYYTHRAAPAGPAAAAAAGPAAPSGALAASQQAIAAQLKEVLAAYRKTIVLLADEKSLSEAEKARANQVGQGLFHDNQLRIGRVDEALAALAASADTGRFASMGVLLDLSLIHI